METNLAEYVKRIRKQAGLTQEAFGYILGVGRSTITNYESGFIKPSTKIYIKLQELDDNCIKISKIIRAKKA